MICPTIGARCRCHGSTEIGEIKGRNRAGMFIVDFDGYRIITNARYLEVIA